jgi:hypothetical protein
VVAVDHYAVCDDLVTRIDDHDVTHNHVGVGDDLAAAAARAQTPGIRRAQQPRAALERCARALLLCVPSG